MLGMTLSLFATEEVYCSKALVTILRFVFDTDGNIVAEGPAPAIPANENISKPISPPLNTVLKIAKKRAFVDAILTATHASKVFTQGIEDIVNLQVVTDNRVESIR